MTITEKVAYLKGLADGLAIDTEKSKEGKLISVIIDILEEMGMSIEDLEENTTALGEELDAVSDDLADVEELLYEDDDDQAVEIYVDGRNAANVTDDGDGETDAEATLAEYIDELNTSVTVSLSDVSYNSVLSAIEEEYSDSENNMSADAELTSSYSQPTEVGNTTRITADVTITYTYTDDNDEEAEVSDTISVTVTVVYVSNDTTATTEA